MTMTVEQVKALVAEIERTAGDDEAAHGLEDALHRQVLEAIANGAPNGMELAREALATVKIDFARWCA
jgi:hypothetical protein